MNLPIRKYKIETVLSQTLNIDAQQIIIDDYDIKFVKFLNETPYLTFLVPRKEILSIMLVGEI